MDTKETKIVTMTLRLTLATKRLIEDQALEKGITPSTWVTILAQQAEKK